MLINSKDIISGVGLAFALLEFAPKLRGKVIDYLKACDQGEHDEDEAIHKIVKYTKDLFYVSDFEKGYDIVVDGIRQAIGEAVPEPEEVKLE